MPTLEKRNGWYSIRYTGPDGKKCRVAVNKLAGRKITLKREAEEVYTRWLVDRSTRFAPAVAVSLTSILDRYIRHADTSMTPDSARTEIARIREFVAWCTDHGIGLPSQVTPLLIEDFKQDVLEGGAKPVTTNRYLERVRAFFNQAIAWRLCETNPFTGVRMLKVHQREPRFLSDDEIARLLVATDGDLRDVVTVALQTGARETEIVRIELAHCREDGIHLVKTKSYRPRTIPYAPGVWEIVERRTELGRYTDATRKSAIYLFDNGRGQPLQGASTWYYWLRLAYARAGISGANFHTLRHTFATRLVRAGVNMRVVQELMGHAHIQTTLRYVHLYDDDRERAVERLTLPGHK